MQEIGKRERRKPRCVPIPIILERSYEIFDLGTSIIHQRDNSRTQKLVCRCHMRYIFEATHLCASGMLMCRQDRIETVTSELSRPSGEVTPLHMGSSIARGNPF